MANTCPQRAGPGPSGPGLGPWARSRPLGPGLGPLWPCIGHVRTYFRVFAHFQTIFMHVRVQVDGVHVQVDDVKVDDVQVDDVQVDDLQVDETTPKPSPNVPQTILKRSPNNPKRTPQT